MPPECTCSVSSHTPRLVVFTGGPGAGKTTALDVARRAFCRHVVVLPESATLLYGGGFPRRNSLPTRRAAQRAIFHVQTELERAALEEGAAVVLCDRGVLDGLAYWPDDESSFFAGVGTTRAEALARYAAVIHLRVPGDGDGYDHTNPLRIETPEQARALDDRTAAAWEGHQNRVVINSTHDFMEKIRRAIAVVRAQIPDCCAGA
ncbi:MAG: ATP-binding protein [Myxococcales bacterium]|nr:ATP-binding protein [Myxococcales bacterium]